MRWWRSDSGSDSGSGGSCIGTAAVAAVVTVNDSCSGSFSGRSGGCDNGCRDGKGAEYCQQVAVIVMGIINGSGGDSSCGSDNGDSGRAVNSRDNDVVAVVEVTVAR